jgi:hypothetical protein
VVYLVASFFLSSLPLVVSSSYPSFSVDSPVSFELFWPPEFAVESRFFLFIWPHECAAECRSHFFSMKI